jgi:rod shape determining protein RodA
LLLIAVIVLNSNKTEHKSWIMLPLGLGTFQPSEIMKIIFILTVADFLARIKEDEKKKVQNIIKLVLYSAIPIGLVFIQPDIGTGLVFVFILIIMLFIYGIPIKILLVTAASITVMVPFAWFFAMPTYMKNRILTFINPSLDPNGSGLNVARSITAVGSGRLSGQGLYQGVMTQASRVPVKESDFIFSVIGEELGFIGAVAIVLLFIVLIIRCVYVAKNAEEHFGSYIVIGISAMFAIHAMENIGMSIGLMPVTGIPLPFVSSGGTALIAYFIGIGVVFSVSLRMNRSTFRHY